ncbi:hypothetical protein DUNSADRAFT_7849 [Dunaliella salina]|uniref:Uncharacterized protein n=1 Tax=Dunaliella salina TaxID=3046 RepID=A0ABQ7GKJ3_DUNSA|nr:hypothetical protein DUNSADRAFT_7849 [Dunaliella salina]|eukprot:KAF5835130.1 hypothetical protein DUNSADRAFT_7849 [Dunaliella salina]
MASLKSYPSGRSGGLPGLRGHPDALPDVDNSEKDNEDHGLKFSSFGPGQGSRAEDRANEAKVVADMEDVYAKAEAQRLNSSAFGSHGPKPSLLRDALNTSHVLSDGAAAIVDDSYPWNWNAYLFPAWVLGVFLRHCILFPLRISLLLLANLLFFPAFFGLSLFLKPGPRRSRLEQRLISWLCGAWMMSWNAVVKYHGPRPTPGPNKAADLCCPHSDLMRTILCSHGVVAVLKQAADLLCTNSDLMRTILAPTVYNKIFVDAFWNSRRQSFSSHMLKLMSSWATVCDVWFLEPQHKREDETSDEFASRVQRMIADTAGLQVVPWDGYLKYYNLGQAKPGLIEKRRKVFADVLRQHLLGGGQHSLGSNKAPLALEDGPGRWRGPPGGVPAPVHKEPSSPWMGPWSVTGWGKEKPHTTPAAASAHHEPAPAHQNAEGHKEHQTQGDAADGTAAAGGASSDADEPEHSSSKGQLRQRGPKAPAAAS